MLYTEEVQALRKLESLNIDPTQRIITLLPVTDWEQATRFLNGNIIKVKYSNLKSRRYFMVHDSDAVITIEGSKATKENIDLAWTLGKPILPLPFTGGASKEKWNLYKNDIINQFQMTIEEVSLMESDCQDIYKMAELCIQIITRRLKPNCFIAMKFTNHPVPNVYGTISGILESKGYSVIRVDQLSFSGSIVREIWDSIHVSDLIIADITDYIPNVFYELGISHALGKKSLILLYNRYGKVPDNVPFDIKVERIFPYDTIDSLKSNLLNNI